MLMIFFSSIYFWCYAVGEPKVTTDKKTNSGLLPIGGDENEIDLDPEQTRHGQGTDKSAGAGENNQFGNEVLIMNTKSEDRTTSFFAQPGILAGKSSVFYN